MEDVLVHPDTNQETMILTTPIQPTGCIPSGYMNSGSKMLTSTANYYAYASVFSVFVFSQRSKRLVTTISNGKQMVSTISFCPSSDLLAVSWRDLSTHIYDCSEKRKLCTFESQSTVIGLAWVRKGTILTGFPTIAGCFYFASPTEDCDWTKVSNFISPVKICRSTVINGHDILITGSDTGDLVRVDFTESAFEMKNDNDSKIVSIEFDPFNPSNCLVCWKNNKWGLYDVSNDLRLIHDSESTGSSISCGAWLSNPPGHFLTGDSQVGVIRLWSTVADTPIEILTLNESGISEMERMKNGNHMIAFEDGSVMIYNWEKRNKIWAAHAGHTNTIFHVSFMPNNDNTLASCAADGSICTWNVDRIEQIDRIVTRKMIISAAPTNGGGYMLCGTSCGSVMAVHMKTRAVVYTIRLFNSRILSIDNCRFDPKYFVAASESGECILYDIEGKKTVWKLSDELWATGCRFSPLEQGTIAVACRNGRVWICREYDASNYTLFKGGDANLFAVAWSPVDRNVLLTSSNSGEVRLWRINETTASTIVVTSHSPKSRPVVFHPTIKWIAASGGYDGTIKVFDIRTGDVLCKVMGHVNHVYGLSFSPKHPCLLVSSSRDTSIRFWSIDHIFIKTMFAKSQSLMLRPLEGLNEFQRLIDRIGATKKDGVYHEKDQAHINDLCRLTRKRTKKMMSASPRETSIIQQATTTKKRMKEAAHLELLSGNTKRYCEYMFAAGEYDKALAAAPSVSFGFWRELMKERIKLFDEPNDIANGLILCDMTEKAVDVLLEKDEFSSALLTAASATSRGRINVKDVNLEMEEVERSDYVKRDFEDEGEYIPYAIASANANANIIKGCIYRAASSYLSIGDVESAFHVLKRNGELYAAWKLNSIFKLNDLRICRNFLQIMGYSSEAYKELTEPMKYKLLICRTFETDEARNKFFESVGFTETITVNDDDTIVDKVVKMCLTGEHAKALGLGLEALNSELQKDAWDYASCRELCQILELIPCEQHKIVMVYSLYLSSFDAAWKGYSSTFNQLLELALPIARSLKMTHMVDLIARQKGAMPISDKMTAGVVPPGMETGVDVCRDASDSVRMWRQSALQWFEVSSYLPDRSGRDVIVY